MADNAQIIRDFVAAWSRLDPDELAGYFCEDGCYYNMPTKPVKGRDYFDLNTFMQAAPKA